MAKAKQAKHTSSNQAKQTPKKNVPAKKQVTKQRGGLLTFLYALILIHAIGAIYIGFYYLKTDYPVSLPWVIPVLTLGSIVALVSVIGMWFWKQWGIYLFAASCVIQAVVHLVLTGSGLVIFYDLLPLAILGYVINMQNKQKLFN